MDLSSIKVTSLTVEKLFRRGCLDSSTSTASLSTVRRGGLSTSTMKSNARHDQVADRLALTKCEEEILPKPKRTRKFC
ncbi:MAG: hypothetical protein DWH99_03630 [Planctomycetota bacterium]|nr:MAG: hypothetical protein DWH99_03630 [Planctomycetota bacterium]